MSHYRILLVHKDKDYEPLLRRNFTYEDDEYGMVEPFGYDYLAPMSETMKVKEALRAGIISMDGTCLNDSWLIGEIIREDESLYRCKGVGNPTERNEREAMAMLDPEYYCTVMDGHL